MWKDKVHFVLVEPREPGNIGASARALKNLGFRHLVLVRPRHFPAPEAQWMAKGAEDVLQAAELCHDLEEALKEKTLVVGTTRRAGRHRGPLFPLRDALPRLRGWAEGGNPVAVLFGREDRGLTNEEAALCGMLLSIPSAPEAPSYNLAQAVLLVAYELAQAEPSLRPPPLVSHQEVLFVVERFREALRLLDYVSRGDRDLEARVSRHLRNIFIRAGLTGWEAQMLHGIITQIKKRLGQEGSPRKTP
jgi:TrmH family RNA methyltransferase